MVVGKEKGYPLSYLLLVVGCWLFVISCLLFVIGCWLFIVYWLLYQTSTPRSLPFDFAQGPRQSKCSAGNQKQKAPPRGRFFF